jgi:hypothetical protein
MLVSGTHIDTIGWTLRSYPLPLRVVWLFEWLFLVTDSDIAGKAGSTLDGKAGNESSFMLD